MLQRQTENCNNSFGQYQLRKLMNNLLKSLDRIDGYVEADLFHTVDGRGGGVRRNWYYHGRGGVDETAAYINIFNCFKSNFKIISQIIGRLLTTKLRDSIIAIFKLAVSFYFRHMEN